MTTNNERREGNGGPDSGERARYPISFVLLIVAAAVYLILRFIQMGGWLLDWLRG